MAMSDLHTPSVKHWLLAEDRFFKPSFEPSALDKP